MYNIMYKYTVPAMKMHKSEKDGNRKRTIYRIFSKSENLLLILLNSTGKKAGPVV